MENLVDAMNEEEVIEAVEVVKSFGSIKSAGIGVVAGAVGVIAYQKGIKPLLGRLKDKRNEKKAAKAKPVDEADVEVVDEFTEDYAEDNE